MNRISLNGKILPSDQAIFRADNRGYRYGDGLFETMKMYEGRILLEHYHLERLRAGLALLQLQLPVRADPESILADIKSLCEKNQCTAMARIRLTVSRGNGGLLEGNPTADYLIECWPLDKQMNALNENGLVIGIYPGARKSMDAFSRLKTNSSLPYVMAALYAKENKLNDCLVLNASGRVADSVIANLFYIKDGTIYTPALGEGCIDGVMRRHLIESLRGACEELIETGIDPADLDSADEIFLSNSIRGIRWVRQLGDKIYGNTRTVDIYRRFVQTLLV